MKLFPSPENKAPPNIHCVEVLTQGGIKLRAAFAVPKHSKGTVLIFQGRAEFIERYFEAMNDLMRRGFAVATFDWRGHGGSRQACVSLLRSAPGDRAAAGARRESDSSPGTTIGVRRPELKTSFGRAGLRRVRRSARRCGEAATRGLPGKARRSGPACSTGTETIGRPASNSRRSGVARKVPVAVSSASNSRK